MRQVMVPQTQSYKVDQLRPLQPLHGALQWLAQASPPLTRHQQTTAALRPLQAAALLKRPRQGTAENRRHEEGKKRHCSVAATERVARSLTSVAATTVLTRTRKRQGAGRSKRRARVEQLQRHLPASAQQLQLRQLKCHHSSRLRVLMQMPPRGAQKPTHCHCRCGNGKGARATARHGVPLQPQQHLPPH